jgi:hypothetical protein
MADEPQEKQLQYASFSFGVSGVAHQQPFPGSPVVVCPLWFPPEGISLEKSSRRRNNSGGLFRLVVIAKKEKYLNSREKVKTKGT